MTDKYKISSMEIREHIRKKSMWIGEKTDASHIIKEVFDNSVDEITNGFADKLLLDWDIANGIYKIVDNGRGIPNHLMNIPLPNGTTMEMNSVIAIFTMPFTSGKHDDEHYSNSKLGQNGVGSTIVNALSEWLICKVKDRKDPYIYHQFEFTNFDNIERKTIKSKTPINFSTYIEFKLNRSDFKVLTFDIEKFRNRCYYLKSKYPKLNIVFGKETIPNITPEEFFYRVTDISKSSKVHQMKFNDLNNSIRMYLSFDSKSKTSTKKSICNTDFVTGQYESEIDNIIHNAIKKAFNFNEISKRDAMDGAKVFFDISLLRPNYIGQVKHAISDNIAIKLRSDFDSLVNSLKNDLVIKERIEYLKSQLTKDDIIQKERKNRKKLIDGTKHKPATIMPGKRLFIVEGDSASVLDSIISSKDTGYMPMGGKIPNALKMTTTSFVNSVKIIDLMDAIGFSFEKYLNNEQQDYNYKNYYILADADDDGLHINTLVAYLFWKYMRDLIIAKRIHIVLAPLYGGYDSNNKFVALYKEEDTHKYKNIERYKGLASIAPQHLKLAIDNPKYHITLTNNIDENILLQMLNIDTKKMLCYSGKFGFNQLLELLGL